MTTEHKLWNVYEKVGKTRETDLDLEPEGLSLYPNYPIPVPQRCNFLTIEKETKSLCKVGSTLPSIKGGNH